MNWNVIKIETTTEAVEALSYQLQEIGINSIEIDDPKDILARYNEDNSLDFVDEKMINSIDKNKVYVKCYISEQNNLVEYLDKIKNVFNEIAKFLPVGSGKIEVNSIKEEQWANTWKKYYKTFKLGERIVVKPSWEKYEQNNENEIVIDMDPGMAFGTGTHETTSMCIELIEKYIKKDKKVLDIGCGSGILSITAAKLGADEVIGVDIDADAVKVAKQNIIDNKVDNIVDIRLGNLMDVLDDKAEIIVANILADVIIGMGPEVPDFLAKNGVFIASGIILDRLEDVKSALISVGFEIIELVTKGEWTALVLKMKE